MKNLKEWEFSLFFDATKGLNNCTPFQSITLERLFEIYTSQYLKEKSNELAQSEGREREILKSQLPYFTPTGVYSYRNNASILSFNSSILPLDIDGLTKQDALRVMRTLSKQRGCVLSIISPRGKGVKALFYLGCEIDKNNFYQTLESNINTIAKNLNIEEFEENIDKAQFKLCQPFFISYNVFNHFDLNAKPTHWGIENKPKKIKEHKPPTITQRTPTSSIEEKRIYAYFDKLCKRDEMFFASLKEGERHANIWRVGGVCSNLHYAPHLEFEFKERLLNAVFLMYQNYDEFVRSRAKKTFEDIWENTCPKHNEILEQIIYEYQNLSK